MSCSACGTLCQQWGARQRGHTLAVLPKRASASVQPLESGSRTELKVPGRAGCSEQPCPAHCEPYSLPSMLSSLTPLD